MRWRSCIRVLPLWTTACLAACGGRVQGLDPSPDSEPPPQCYEPECQDASPDDRGTVPEAGPPAREAGPPNEEPEAGSPESGSPEAGRPEGGPPEAGRPEGPCPPAQEVLEGAPCQAGPQTCAGDPAPCDGRTFYDALVCEDPTASGDWRWSSIATTICGDAGTPDVRDLGPDEGAPDVATDGSFSLDSIPVRDLGVCVPWSTVRGQPFSGAANPGEPAATLLSSATTEAVDNWVGHATSPWGGWDVLITFSGDGHYAALAFKGTTVSGTPPPFYYGATTGCDSLKQWSLSSVDATGAMGGELDVPFSYGPDTCGLPTWRGVLSLLLFDASGDRLHFDWSRSDGYGPIVYDLWRVCP